LTTTDGGLDALIEKTRRATNIKNRVDEAIEQAVVCCVIDQPGHGQLLFMIKR
jgi:hypothetical protein